MQRLSLTQDYPVLIPYQVDFHTTTVGKHISLTKRHVRWKFGFAHIQSLLKGESGVSCRGVELEIHLIWSVASGKYVIYLNKIPLQQQLKASGMVNKFQFSCVIPESALPGMHQLCMTVWATPATVPPGEVQCNLSFDGQSFHEFFRIFELGSARMTRIYGNVLNNMVEKLGSGRRQEPNAPSFDARSIVQGRRRYQPGLTDSGKKKVFRSPSDPAVFAKVDGIKQKRVNQNDRYLSRDSITRTSGIIYSPPSFVQTSKPSGVQKAANRQRRTDQLLFDEVDDLIQLESEDVIPPIVRCASSVTLDTMLQESKKSVDQDVQQNYTPEQLYETNQNLSFRLQKPPVFADSVAGDLIQSHSCVDDVAGTNNVQGFVPKQNMMMPTPISSILNAQQNVDMSISNFQAAPPPTWETLNSAYSSNPRQPNTMYPQQY